MAFNEKAFNGIIVLMFILISFSVAFASFTGLNLIAGVNSMFDLVISITNFGSITIIFVLVAMYLSLKSFFAKAM